MAAVFAGASHAPIAGLVIVFELTGQYSIILPLMAAVALATGSGAANRDFATFETVSDRALTTQASSLSDSLDHARSWLTVMAWLLLLAGIVAAVATWRGRAPDGDARR